MRVFVTGGTGLVGRRLVDRLVTRGHRAVVLSRSPGSPAKLQGDVEVVAGNPCVPGPWQRFLENCDAVVNLAGENLFARRWSVRQKDLLRSSRLDATRVVADTLRSVNGPKVLINGSAIGWYGYHQDRSFDESSPPGDDFLAKMCLDWEEAAQVAQAGRRDVRLVQLRTGVVLDRRGGALVKMAMPFFLFAGGHVGSGRQWMSWIHHEDLANLIVFALENEEVGGPLNGSAPVPLPMREVCAALGRVLGSPSWLPAPGFALRIALGEVADVVLQGQRVLPKAAQDAGFEFRFSDVEDAFADLYSKAP